MGAGIKKISENVISDGRALALTNGSIADNGIFPIGTLRCNPMTKGLEFKYAANVFSKFDAAAFLEAGSITTALLADGCVTTPKLADGAVTNIKLGDLAVTTSKIANGSITEVKIANSAVSNVKLADGSVTTSKYADLSITNAKLSDNSINGNKLIDGAITTAKIGNLSVTGAKIANNTIISTNLQDGSVTFQKLAKGSVYGDVIADNGIGTLKYGNNSITGAKLADGAVTNEKVADNGIGQGKLADLSVTSTKLANGAVTAAKIGDGEVTSNKYANLSISKGKLTADLASDIENAVKYVGDDVTLRRNLSVIGNIDARGSITGARVYNATYMDLAEAYIPGEPLEAGDIVALREDGMVYRCNSTLDKAVVGVISDNYASCYGATYDELADGDKVAVGLIGKVPVKVFGHVDYVGQPIIPVADGEGVATLSERNYRFKIGKALETKDTPEMGLVMCLIYPN